MVFAIEVVENVGEEVPGESEAFVGFDNVDVSYRADNLADGQRLGVGWCVGEVECGGIAFEAIEGYGDTVGRLPYFSNSAVPSITVAVYELVPSSSFTVAPSASPGRNRQ